MDLSTFIVSVLCLIDDRLKERCIRSRGPAPKLSDAEVITIEIVAEFLGIDTEKAIHLFFRRHYGEWFPTLGEVHRSTFARQAANLWKIKEELWHELLLLAPHDPTFALVDSMPLPACACSPVPIVAAASREKPPSAKIPSSSRPSTALGC